MVFPLVEHIPYCTFNHVIKAKLRHLVIKAYWSCAYQCFGFQTQKGQWQFGVLMPNSVTSGKQACGSAECPRCILRLTSQLHAGYEMK